MSAVVRIEPRWTDLDPVGHVNNSVYLVYAEEARARFMRELPEVWRRVVVVHNSIDYHRPVEISDGAVDVACTATAIGTSSFTTTSVVTTVAGHKCATIRTVQVGLRPDGAGSQPWSDNERALLEGLLAT